MAVAVLVTVELVLELAGELASLDGLEEVAPDPPQADRPRAPAATATHSLNTRALTREHGSESDSETGAQLLAAVGAQRPR